MDVILERVDTLFLERSIYNNPTIIKALSDDNQELWSSYTEIGALPRTIFSIYVILIVGGLLMYLSVATLSYFYFFVYKKDVYYPENQPQPYKGQVKDEIYMSVMSTPNMAHLTVPIFLAELQGYSLLYDNIDDYGYAYLILSVAMFLFFTDTCIYWIHRWLHEIPWAYKYIHKDHHKWKIPTPFAAIAFHPVDGWLQSTPYHLFIFLFPFYKWFYIAGFVFVQLWTLSIHDGASFHPASIINGSAHHQLHHSKFLYNYGQFFTFWDRHGGTFKDPFALDLKDRKKIDAEPGSDLSEDASGSQAAKKKARRRVK
eukprot:Rmarinus@m.17050